MAAPRYLPGTTVAGHYTITGTLGTGGTSGVYRARDTVMNRTVAIKIIGGESPATASRNFMTEARAAAVLSHPNIVNVYDILDDGQEKYIIMEYVCGITLREYLDHHGHLSVRESVNCAHQILSALHAAHSRGIVHRDIKPGNILITTEGRIKVTDFGIARLPDRDSFLMPDRTVGTVHYVSPEQASGGAVDERSDLYSLGILLYEMLTGRRPFLAERPADVAMMQISTRPEPPSYYNPSIPQALEKIVMCALEKDPAARFDSAAEMSRMLCRLPDDLLSGRARPLREEASAYRLTVERLDERTVPFPKARRKAEKRPEEEMPTEREEQVEAPAEPTFEQKVPERPTPPPPPPPAPAPQEVPPPPTPIGNMMDAFTAEDTMDIMLAHTECRAEPIIQGEPILPPLESDVAEEVEDAPEEEEEPILPPPEELSTPPVRKGGDGRTFHTFMLVAAAVLAALLLIGIVKGLAATEDGKDTPSPSLWEIRTEEPYAL